MKIFRWYQKDIFKLCRKLLFIGLLLEMRLGKTLIVIRLVKSWSKKETKRILIVLPLEAIDDWIDELTEEKEYSISELTGLKKNRLKELAKNNKWNFINYRGATTIQKELLAIHWDMVILDESVKIKNPKTNQSKFFVNNFRNIKRRMIMSGCWDPEDDLDMIQQINFLDENIIQMKYYEFRARCCRLSGFNWVINKKYKGWLFEQVSKCCFSLKRKDVGLDQEEVHTKRTFTLPSELKKPYKQLEDMMVLEMNGVEMTTMHSLQTYYWMKMVSSGILEGKIVNDFKIKELQYLLENDLKHEQVIISTTSKKELHCIEAMFKKRKYKFGVHHGDVDSDQRKLVKKNFKKGYYKYLLVNPETVTYGVNLSNANTIIHYSLPASYNTYNQFKDRIVDVDSKDKLWHIYFITKDTVDEIDYERITKKGKRVLKNHNLIKRIQQAKLELF